MRVVWANGPFQFTGSAHDVCFWDPGKERNWLADGLLRPGGHKLSEEKEWSQISSKAVSFLFGGSKKWLQEKARVENQIPSWAFGWVCGGQEACVKHVSSPQMRRFGPYSGP